MESLSRICNFDWDNRESNFPADEIGLVGKHDEAAGVDETPEATGIYGRRLCVASLTKEVLSRAARPLKTYEYEPSLNNLITDATVPGIVL